MGKRERKVVPGRGMAVGTCVVYFGSRESWGVGAGVEEAGDKAAKAAESQSRVGYERQLERQLYCVRTLF